MEKKHCLFIGGIVDGKRIVMTTENKDFYPVIERREVNKDGTQNIKRHEYRLEKIHTENKTFYLFIPNDWTIERGIEKLVNGYCTERIE